MPTIEGAPQSWSSAIVDIATIGAMLAMALGHVQEPAAWTLLGGIISGRFGVSLGKTIARTAATSGGADGGPGNSMRPPPGPGAGRSAGGGGTIAKSARTALEKSASAWRVYRPVLATGATKSTHSAMEYAKILALASAVACAVYVAAHIR